MTALSSSTDSARVDALRLAILEAWHASRAAGNCTRYDRMLYVRRQVAPKWPGIAAKALWFHIEEFTAFSS